MTEYNSMTFLAGTVGFEKGDTLRVSGTTGSELVRVKRIVDQHTITIARYSWFELLRMRVKWAYRRMQSRFFDVLDILEGMSA